MRKRAIVTGGSRGIGWGIALELAAKDYDIALSYRSMAEEAQQVAEEIRTTYGVRCFVYQASLEEDGAALTLFQNAVQDLGGVDLLVNNAGRTVIENILDLKPESVDLLLNLELRTCLLLTQAVARHMVEHGIRGSIINITSSRGERAYPCDGVYGGVKAALARATESIALDLAPYGIRVNCVAPGSIQVRTAETLEEKSASYLETIEKLGKKIPLGRIGQPEDVAKAVAFLASKDASYITGITLRVDGGLILPGMPERSIPGTDDHGWGWRQSGFVQAMNERKGR